MTATTERTVKSMVLDDFRTASVFEKHSIDFCCNGNKPLDAACAEKGLDPEQVLREIEAMKSGADDNNQGFAQLSLDALIDHIVTTHHAYVRLAIPALLIHTAKVASVHGQNHPELLTIAEKFKAVADELTNHMMKEERILFPYIKSLANAQKNGTSLPTPPFGSVVNPIRMMEAEHQSAGDALYYIREASNGYTVPADGCTTFKVTYQELEQFEMDLHQHVHLENNILFPKAIELEKTVLL
jgi:regulator of cell morphogenesis and NO signaling